MSPLGTNQRILQPGIEQSAVGLHGDEYKKQSSLHEMLVSGPMIHEDDFVISLLSSQMGRTGLSLHAAIVKPIIEEC